MTSLELTPTELHHLFECFVYGAFRPDPPECKLCARLRDKIVDASREAEARE